MSVRKQILEVLTRTRLKQIGGRLGRDYAASAKRGDVVNSLNRTRSISLADILGEMMRDELKRACVALDLNNSGREKKLLIHRILAADRTANRPKPRASRATRSQVSERENKTNRKTKTLSILPTTTQRRNYGNYWHISKSSNLEKNNSKHAPASPSTVL